MSTEQERAERFLFSLSSLAEIGEAIFSNRRDVTESLRWLLEMTLGMMRIGRGAILLYDESQRTLTSAVQQRIDEFDSPISLSREELTFLRQHRILSANPLPEELDSLCRHHRQQMEALAPAYWVLLGVPDRFIGVISLSEVFTGEPLEDQDRDFLAVLAHHISLAINGAELLSEMRQANFQLRWQTQQLLTLSEVSAEISSVLDPEPLMEKILQHAIMLLDAHAGMLVMTEEGHLVPKAQWGELEISSDNLKGSVVERAMQQEIPLRVHADAAEAETFGVSTLLVASVRAQDKTFGALLVCDKESREGHVLEFDDADEMLLGGLANQAGVAIENARLYQDALRLRQIEAEMMAAAEIQRGLLPEHSPAIPGYDIAGISIPRGRIGGDYFDYIHEDDKRLGLVIADVSGKGTQAALLMATLRAGVLFEAEQEDLQTMVLRLNDLLYRSTPHDKFATFFYARLEWESHELTSINAGHNPPLIFRTDGSVERLDASGTLVGAFPNDILPHISSYTTQQSKLRSGDVLLLYTDGVTEANNAEDELFEVERLIEVVQRHRLLTATELVYKIQAAVDAFQGEVEPFDDFTLVVVKRTA